MAAMRLVLGLAMMSALALVGLGLLRAWRLLDVRLAEERHARPAVPGWAYLEDEEPWLPPAP